MIPWVPEVEEVLVAVHGEAPAEVALVDGEGHEAG